MIILMCGLSSIDGFSDSFSVILFSFELRNLKFWFYAFSIYFVYSSILVPLAFDNTIILRADSSFEFFLFKLIVFVWVFLINIQVNSLRLSFSYSNNWFSRWVLEWFLHWISTMYCTSLYWWKVSLFSFWWKVLVSILL